MDEVSHHINEAWKLILNAASEWPQQSDLNLSLVIGVLDVTTTVHCMPPSVPPGVKFDVRQHYPCKHLLDFGAGILRDSELRDIIYKCCSKEIRAKVRFVLPVYIELGCKRFDCVIYDFSMICIWQNGYGQHKTWAKLESILSWNKLEAIFYLSYRIVWSYPVSQ